MATTYDYEIASLVTDNSGDIVTVNFTITADDGEDEFTHSYSTGIQPVPFAGSTEAALVAQIIAEAGEQNMFQESADAELAANKLRKVKKVKERNIPWVKRVKVVKVKPV